ncbi:uncharacterized protein LOC111703352 isoform X2 [Eurytemora carolleeae]|nr:uncharacterized protein LOC111703352 isoform X2 [Eurytemora carolleeae]|eukprot:XP_023331030.1 uncharacterized protein LOC111703352 isoform X2 [Eurytemora affinis]
MDETSVVSLLGSKDKPAPQLELGVWIELQEEPESISSVSETTIKRTREHSRTAPGPQPILIQNGTSLYFQIGSISECTRTYNFKIEIVNLSNLKLLNRNEEDVEIPTTPEYQLVYSFLGISKTSSVFSDLEFTGFTGNTVSSEVRSNPSVLFQFLSEYGFEINVCSNNMVLGSALVDVGKVLPLDRFQEPYLEDLEFTGDIPVVAAYNLSTPRDNEGRSPKINLRVVLNHVNCDQLSSKDSDMTRISEGELSYISSSSDPDSRIEQTTIHKESIPHELNSLHIPSQVLQPKPTPGSPFHPVNGPEPTQKTDSGLTKLRHDPSTGLPKPVFIAPNPRSEKKKGSKIDEESRCSPPTKLPKPAVVPPSADITFPDPDERDCNSPPPPKSMKMSSPPKSRKMSPPQPFALSMTNKFDRKLFIDLVEINLLESFSNISIQYCYPPISKQNIVIGDYNITAGEILDLTNGSYEFNFSASQAELLHAFKEYHLKLKVLSGTTQIASCFLRLDHLLDAPSIDGLQERSSQETIISEHGVLGYIRVSLEMHTDLGSGSKYSQKKSQPRFGGPREERDTDSEIDKVLRLNRLNEVAYEVEKWKRAKQAEFISTLHQVETQHIQLLSREWKARKEDHEREHREKEQVLINRELELDRKQEELKIKELEIENRKKTMEEEQLRMKQDRNNLLNKLRKELREKEQVNTEKVVEISELKSKLGTTEQELKKVRGERDKKLERHSSLVSDLKKINEKCKDLEKTVEFAEQELIKKDVQISRLREDNKILNTEQSMQIRELTAQLNRLLSLTRERTAEKQPEPDLPLSPRSLSSRSSTETSSLPTQRENKNKVQRTNQKIQVSASKDLPILCELLRMEKDLEMLLRAGYPEDHTVIRQLKKKIEECYSA